MFEKLHSRGAVGKTSRVFVQSLLFQFTPVKVFEFQPTSMFGWNSRSLGDSKIGIHVPVIGSDVSFFSQLVFFGRLVQLVSAFD